VSSASPGAVVDYDPEVVIRDTILGRVRDLGCDPVEALVRLVVWRGSFQVWRNDLRVERLSPERIDGCKALTSRRIILFSISLAAAGTECERWMAVSRGTVKREPNSPCIHDSLWPVRVVGACEERQLSPSGSAGEASRWWPGPVHHPSGSRAGNRKAVLFVCSGLLELLGKTIESRS